MEKVYIVIAQQESEIEWPHVWGTSILAAFEDVDRAEAYAKQKRMVDRNRVIRVLMREVH